MYEGFEEKLDECMKAMDGMDLLKKKLAPPSMKHPKDDPNLSPADAAAIERGSMSIARLLKVADEKGLVIELQVVHVPNGNLAGAKQEVMEAIKKGAKDITEVVDYDNVGVIVATTGEAAVKLIQLLREQGLSPGPTAFGS